jgi:hypothetical protein
VTRAEDGSDEVTILSRRGATTRIAAADVLAAKVFPA